METNIHVFVTKTKKIRAQLNHIDENGMKLGSEEVTVGGNKWKEERFSEYRSRIITKCRGLLTRLNHEMQEAITQIELK